MPFPVTLLASLLFAGSAGTFQQPQSALYAFNPAKPSAGPLWSLSTNTCEVNGLFVDSSLNLWLATSTCGVVEYAPPSPSSPPSAPERTLGASGVATSIAVCGSYLYANVSTNTGGLFEAWNLSQTRPRAKTLATFYGYGGGGVACDASGDVFVSLADHSGAGFTAELFVFPPGESKKPRQLEAVTPYSSALAISHAGLVASTDSYATSQGAAGVQFFACSLQTFVCTQPGPTVQLPPGGQTPWGVAFQKSDHSMWVADPDAGMLWRQNPKTGKLLASAAVPRADAVALSPPDR